MFQQGFIAELSAKYNILPFTQQTAQLISGLALLVSEGVIPPVQPHETYFNYLDRYGIKEVLRKGRYAEKDKHKRGRPFVWSG